MREPFQSIDRIFAAAAPSPDATITPVICADLRALAAVIGSGAPPTPGSERLISDAADTIERFQRDREYLYRRAARTPPHSFDRECES